MEDLTQSGEARGQLLLSVFLTADSAPRNPIREWVPSQNGLVTDPPQRQRENAGLPVRSYLLPSASTSSIEPSGSSTRYGPFLRIVILTGMRPPCSLLKIAERRLSASAVSFQSTQPEAH